jgi:hypothetical protein
MLFDSTDAGRTWTRRTVISSDFDRHISQVLPSTARCCSSRRAARWPGRTTAVRRGRDGSPYQGSFFGALQDA